MLASGDQGVEDLVPAKEICTVQSGFSSARAELGDSDQVACPLALIAVEGALLSAAYSISPSHTFLQCSLGPGLPKGECLAGSQRNKKFGAFPVSPSLLCGEGEAICMN